ncbi:MAG: two component transcriptional regulator, LuxR family [Bacteroidota bacterium]|jgi:DNA-binding NarL/FixJ family response regulator|nr:two component transcriptional regulator, LuxR family [Bacteroidota bacterium]
MIKKIRILLADDHEVVRNGLKLMLSQQKAFLPVIDEASDGEEVLQILSQKSFDIILLDISLPKQNGIDITKLLMKRNASTKILALTMHKEEYIIKQMISAGALGYLLKNTGVDELTKAILTVSSSNRYYCNEASQVLISNSKNDLPILNKKFELNLNQKNVLSTREREVMFLIVKELSSAQIAEKLFISKRTVDSHRKNIISKLNLKNTAGLVKYALQHNLLNENLTN